MNKLYLKIRNRLEWLGLKLLIGLFSLMPIETASNVAGKFARVVGPYVGKSNVARRNLKASFPDWSDEKIKAVIADMWESLGRYFGEFPHIAKLTNEEFLAMTEFVGKERLLSLKDHNNGALIFSCHMANWELGAKAAHVLQVPLSVVYRPLNNEYVNELVNSYRDQYQSVSIAKSNTGGRELIKGLKEGSRVAILIDQKMNTGIPVPFFGRDAMTTTSIADLAMRYGYPVIPARVERLAHAPKFRITIYPPLEYEVTGEYEKDARNIMLAAHAMMESWITERPEQWFWLHKRWDSSQRVAKRA